MKCIQVEDKQTKQKLAEQMAKALSEELSVDIKKVSVSIKDVPPEKWQEQVVNRIAGEKDLYIDTK